MTNNWDYLDKYPRQLAKKAAFSQGEMMTEQSEKTGNTSYYLQACMSPSKILFRSCQSGHSDLHLLNI